MEAIIGNLKIPNLQEHTEQHISELSRHDVSMCMSAIRELVKAFKMLENDNISQIENSSVWSIEAFYLIGTKCAEFRDELMQTKNG